MSALDICLLRFVQVQVQMTFFYLILFHILNTHNMDINYLIRDTSQPRHVSFTKIIKKSFHCLGSTIKLRKKKKSI